MCLNVGLFPMKTSLYIPFMSGRIDPVDTGYRPQRHPVPLRCNWSVAIVRTMCTHGCRAAVRVFVALNIFDMTRSLISSVDVDPGPK